MLTREDLSVTVVNGEVDENTRLGLLVWILARKPETLEAFSIPENLRNVCKKSCGPFSFSSQHIESALEKHSASSKITSLS